MGDKKTLEFYWQEYDYTTEVWLDINYFSKGGNLYIALIEMKTDLLISVLTINLEDECKRNQAYLNTELPAQDVAAFLEKHELGVPTGHIEYSGSNAYLLYQFNEKRLRELDPEGYAVYEKTFERREKEDNYAKQEMESRR